MKRIAVFTLAVSVALTVAAYSDQYDSCRCKNGLATVGDSSQEVLSDCGQPLRKESGQLMIRGKRIYAQKWIYNFGPQEFMQAIAFGDNGKVVTVESLGRGY